MKFVVIGGDAAGMSAASKAKRNASDLEVTVLEKTGDVSYSACGMPYNIADARREIDDLVVRPAAVFKQKQGIEVLTGYTVEAIDPAGKVVRGTTLRAEPFEFPYDRLLIATGARPIMTDVPGTDLPGVMVLKSLEDGRNIKTTIAQHNVKKAVIIGMGYIGLEMAEALRARQIQVAMVKPGPDLLPWMGRELAEVVRRELDANRVGIHPGQAIDGIESDETGLKVNCADITLDTDLVLMAAGVQPNSELALQAGIAMGAGNAIAVDRGMRTSDNAIYAAGDCADAYHVVTGSKTWIPLALRANRAGWAVADNICGKPVELPGVAGTAVFKAFDLEVARTGLSMAEAVRSGFDIVDMTIESNSRAHAHPGSSAIFVYMLADRKSGRLLGAQMVGREGAAHRINAAAVALHNHMTVEDFVQTDLAYAPPFGPVWDPLLTAANQLLKKL